MNTISKLRAFLQLSLLCLVMLAGGRAYAFDVTPGMTGTWYDPSHDGEGFILQVMDDENALVFWFTYDTSGKQFWTLGLGSVEGNEIEFPDMLQFSGGKFGPEFDKDDVESSRWGSLTLSFESCDVGTAAYSNTTGFGNGSQAIQKLTSVWGFGCDGRQNAIGDAGKGLLEPGFTGAWYDFEHDGEGFTVEMIGPETALVYWFTYDTAGNPAWMVSVATVDGTNLFANELLQPVGGRFGENFDPGDVRREFWGSAVFSFGSCANGGMRYQGPPSYGPESTQVLSRLSGITGARCGFLAPTARVQGALNVAENTFVDGDTNDANTAFEPNNGNGEWQDIFTPAQVSGFVTAQPFGEPGARFEKDADEGDLYRVTLRQGEVVALDIATPDPRDGGGDLDLWLYDVRDTSEPVASSVSASPLEKLVAPFTGEFFLWVWAYEGTSNYTLRTGWDAPDSASMLTVNAPMAHDEVLVQFEPGSAVDASPDLLADAAAISDLSQINVVPTGSLVDGLGLFEINAPYVDMQAAYPFPLEDRGFGIGDRRPWVQVVTAKRLLARDDVTEAAPNYLLSAEATPNDFLFPNQWHYRAIGLEEAWDVTVGSKDVVVAVIDSGVAPHPDLISNVDYSLGYDFARNTIFNPSYDGDGIDSDARDYGIPFSPEPYLSHGTHVAGTVGATTDNVQGASGVAWDVTIMPVRVGAKAPSCEAVVDGLRWAGQLENHSGTVPRQKADVVNLSLSVGPNCVGLDSAIDRLHRMGIVVVASAGNKRTSQRFYPAASPGVVSVSATDRADTLAIYSNYGSSIDVAAPGGDTSRSDFGGVWSPTYTSPSNSTFYGPDVIALNGTSMAAPHVAGVAALMKSVYPDMTADDFDYALSSGAITDDLAQNGESNKDSSFGYGRINARKAVNWAYAEAFGGDRETFITASASSLDFDSTTTSVLIDVQKSGPADVFFETWYREYDFVQLEPVSINAQNFGTYRVTVNRSGLPQGQYRTALWFEANNGSIVRVNIDFRVGQPVPGDAGALYGVLMDAYSFTPAYWWNGTRGSNRYAVQFDDVAPGLYFLLVGSDMDGDFTFCDEGEFCQLYPNWTEASVIEVSGGNVDLAPMTLTAPLSNAASSSSSFNAAQYGADEPASEVQNDLPWGGEVMLRQGVRRQK